MNSIWNMIVEAAQNMDEAELDSPIRKKGVAQGDPKKADRSAEVFSTDIGIYFLYREKNGGYTTVFVDKSFKKVAKLGNPQPDRKTAVDILLGDHDERAAGLGEATDNDKGEKSC